MKILFVENRYKTGFWELIAKRLMSEGHEIYWIIQNHFFKPSIGERNVIPYFKFKSYIKKDRDIKKIIDSDRAINFFGIKSDDFIYYYYDQILKIIQKVKPDMAFGEATLFHELLTAEICKKNDILYLHPTSCRYPLGRFSFYKYDTLEPFGGSEEVIENEEAVDIIYKIKNHQIRPDYMTVPVPGFIDKLKNKITITSAQLLGEKFNTPSLFQKMKLENERKRVIKEWDRIAASDIIDDDNTFKVLYPMQYQPEANIDVWGYPFNNQENIIRDIISKIPDSAKLYVKPNPKSKYELNASLLDFVKSNNKIVPLSHSVRMDSIFSKIDFVVTVTGTISFECIWGDRPFLMLGTQGIQKKYCKYDSSVLPLLDHKTFKGMILLSTAEEKTVLIQELVATSYKGYIGDTFLNTVYLDKNNIDNVTNAFKNILLKIRRLS